MAMAVTKWAIRALRGENFVRYDGMLDGSVAHTRKASLVRAQTLSTHKWADERTTTSAAYIFVVPQM